jgi:hypothetical protein
VLLCFAVGLLAVSIAPRAGAQALTPEAYNKVLNLALDEVEQRIPADARQRIQFGLNLFFAHEVWVHEMPLEALLKTVDAFKEAGVDRVDINPGQYPWVDGDEEVIAKYNAVVARIREDGMKLALNPLYSPAFHTVASFSAWRRLAVSLYSEWAERYKPDNFVIVHEPSTMAARLGQDISVADWVGFVRQLTAEVKKKSPSSRIGAGGLAEDQAFLDAFSRMAIVDFITLDIYNTTDLAACNRIIRKAQLLGKSVYIEETWRPPYYPPGPDITPDLASLKNIGNAAFQAVDSRWIRVMTAYAQVNRLEAITPVWPWPLFSYMDDGGNLDDPAYNQLAIAAVLSDARTSTFDTVKAVVAENRNLPASAALKARK